MVGRVPPLALMLAAAACGPLFGCTGTIGYDIDEEAFAADYVTAYCGWARRCDVVRDEGACIASATTAHFARAMRMNIPRRPPVPESHVTFDPAAASRIVDAIAGAECHAWPPPCVDCVPWRGTLGEAATCLSTASCQPHLFCKPAADGCAGKCTKRRMIGESANSPQECESGLTTVDGTCTATPRREGQLCRTTWEYFRTYGHSVDECEAGTTCAGSGLGSGGRCLALPDAEGESCGTLECLQPWLSCDPSDRCAKRGSLGDPCAPGSCKLDLVCRDTCGLPGREGDVCASDGDCLPDLHCGLVSAESPVTACLKPRETCESCSDTRECAAGLECAGSEPRCLPFTVACEPMTVPEGCHSSLEASPPLVCGRKPDDASCS